MVINISGGNMSQEEQDEYIKRGMSKFGSELSGIDIELHEDAPDEVTVTYHVDNPPFERIRRITG